MNVNQKFIFVRIIKALSLKHNPFAPVLLAALIFAGCAQQGNPSGGPKDEDPPAVLTSEPENYSNHFSSEKAEVTFDEYIVLDNVNQELIVSPPLEEKPAVKLKGKTLVIEIPGELHDSTTYTFNFGNAIKDLHEGNRLPNFEYVFSTGETVDSLSVKGTLRYAYDLKAPADPLYIMLYGDLRDSVPMSDPPFYLGRSDDKGNFSLNNLRPGVYKVFALKDANNNLLFDMPTEEIAFLDSSLIVSAEFFKSIIEAQDTARTDSLTELQEPTVEAPVSDTILVTDTDSLKNEYKKYNSVYIELSVFTEENTQQYLSDYSRKDRRRLDLIFSKPVTDSFSINAIRPASLPQDWYICQAGSMRDTLAFWLPDSTLYLQDTISTLITYTLKDSLGMPYSRYDTLNFVYREAPKSKKPQPSQNFFSLKTIGMGGQQDLNRGLTFTGTVPISSFDPAFFSLNTVIDSIETPVPFSLKKDSVLINRLGMDVAWESGMSYALTLYPGAVTSIFGDSNDTIRVNFKSREKEYYGNLFVSVANVNGPVILILYSGDKVIRKKSINSAGIVTFDYLAPQKYTVKFIHDRNNNGKWDTGKYLAGRQPEKVEWLSKELEVRSNWDLNEEYTLED